MEIQGGLLTLLRCLFDTVSVMVRIGGQMSRKIPMGRELLQGSLYYRRSLMCYRLSASGSPQEAS